MSLIHLISKGKSLFKGNLISFKVSLLFVAFIGFNSIGQIEYELGTEVDDAQLALWASEVYQDCPEYASSEHLEIYRKQINKIVITEVSSLNDFNDLIDLSTMALKNKCNANLLPETSLNFLPSNFNPLKYFFDFHASENKSYYVNGANFIITINQ